MSNDCLFCSLIEGSIPSAKVYETEKVLAFLDIAPMNEGHTLIIPKYHAETILDLPLEYAEEILKAQKAVALALMQSMNAKGFNCFQNNFSFAGQVVPHVHWHIIPRFSSSEFPLWNQGKYNSQESMRELAQKIAHCIE